MSGIYWLMHCLQPIVSHIFVWWRLYKPSYVDRELLCPTLHRASHPLHSQWRQDLWFLFFGFSGSYGELCVHWCMNTVMIIAIYNTIILWDSSMANLYFQLGHKSSLKQQLIEKIHIRGVFITEFAHVCIYIYIIISRDSSTLDISLASLSCFK